MAAAAALGLPLGACAGTDHVGSASVCFNTSRVTWTSLDISPDDTLLTFACLGQVYHLPVTGGQARPLTFGRSWNTQPRYSPDGKSIAFLSDRSGRAELWRMCSDGSSATRVTEGLFVQPRLDAVFDAAPFWAPNGELLVDIRSIVHRINHDGNSNILLSPVSMPLAPGGVLSLDDGRLKHSTSSGHRVLPGGCVISANRACFAYAPPLATNVLARVHALADPVGEEVIDELRVERNLDNSTETTQGLALARDGGDIYIAKFGRLFRVRINTRQSQEILFSAPITREMRAPTRREASLPDNAPVTCKTPRWPTVNLRESAAYFSALGHLHRIDLGDRTTARMTQDRHFEFAPAQSPDGQWIAYATWSEEELGHIFAIRACGGNAVRITREAGRYSNPCWAPDGTRIAFISDESGMRWGAFDASQASRANRFSLREIAFAEESQHHEVHPISPLDVAAHRYPCASYSSCGQRLFLTTSAQLAERAERVQLSSIQCPLARNDADSSSANTPPIMPHLALPSADEIAISPNSKMLALVRGGELIIAPLPSHLAQGPPPGVADSVVISDDGPMYVQWISSSQISWVSGTRLLLHDLVRAVTTDLGTIEVSLPAQHCNARYALTNCRVIPCESDDIVVDATIVIDGRRIESVSTAPAPPNVHVIDLNGATVIPGLIDTHCHLHFEGRDIWHQHHPGYVGMLAYGVTTIHDPQAPGLDAFGQAELVEAGLAPGPRVFASGGAIKLSGSTDALFRNVSSLEDARRCVRHHTRHGAGLLKLYTIAERRQNEWIIEAASDAGANCTTHTLNATDAALIAFIDGVVAYEHLLWRETPVHDDIQGALGAIRAHITPTFGPLREMARDLDTDDDKFRRFMSPERIAEINAAANYQGEPENRTPKWRMHVELTRAGVTLSTGGHGNGPYGLYTHMEMWSFVDAGMSPMDALKSATAHGAAKLGLQHELGSIKAGKIADLLVLEADPLTDIRNSTTIRYVMKDGYLHDGRTLDRLWPSPLVLETPAWRRHRFEIDIDTPDRRARVG